MGLNFAIYETMKQLTTRHMADHVDFSSPSVLGNVMSMARNGLCGAVAGGMSKFAVYPLDTVKRRMQVQVLANTLQGAASVPRYLSSWTCFSSTLKNEGLSGLYKVSCSLCVACMRDACVRG